MQPYTYPNGPTFTFVSARAGALSVAHAELCAELSVPFFGLPAKSSNDRSRPERVWFD